jgi:uncharacterized protein YcbK (DUF882 family)
MGDLSNDFSRREFACKCGCGADTIDAGTLKVLQDLRYHFLQPVTVNSGHRCRTYNRKVGGAANSQHLTGRAADVTVMGIHPSHVADYFERTYPNMYGIGRYATFTHIDTRSGPPARWSA